MRHALSRALSKCSGFVKRKAAEIDIVLNNIRTPHQKKKIRDLISQDEFTIIIFDSCRYDYFKKMYEDYYSGNLDKVYNTNTYTKQYQRSTWTGSHDITYIAGGPVISDRNFELSNLDYRPSEHFEEIVDVWDMGYKKELGVTPPEAVTKEALQCDAQRKIVHYFQPHAPYIGDVRLRSEVSDTGGGKDEKIENRRESLLEIYDEIESGQIDKDELIEAYKSNLKRVMSAARPLVDETEAKTIITSDHGELLGEDERYLHGGLPHKILCELPWFETEGVNGEVHSVRIKKIKHECDDKGVKGQLRDLGYV